MRILRSDRFAAIALAIAAIAGLLVANSALGSGVNNILHVHLGWSGVADLSIAHWVTDGLLAIFFFIVAVDLRHEFTHGELNSPRKAAVPAIAAVFGVLVPAALYLVMAGGTQPGGWPIPTATDIAFALGLIALVGRNLPKRIRVFLLALAVLDDLIAIVIIAVFFAQSINFGALFAAAIMLLFFWQAGKPNKLPWLRPILLSIFAVLTWLLVYNSGVHATIAGVALGLVMKPELAEKTVHSILPFNNAVVLPLFAFVSALVVIPNMPLWQMSAVFFGIVIALPVGKLIGITLGGWLANTLMRVPRAVGINGWDLVTVAAVGGIGFTVSLLMNELALADDPALSNQGVLAVLTGSAISIVLGGLLVAWRSRVNTRAGGHERPEDGLDPTD